MIKKDYVAVDIAKFIAAIFVAIIHCNPFKYVSTGLADSVDLFGQLAVPLFFMFSAYFLFSKWGQPNFTSVLIQYVKRIAIMYGLWFIIMLPMTWDLAFEGKDLISYRTIRMFLFGSTFRGSWYLAASIGAAIVVSMLSRFMSTSKVILLCIPLYGICVMSSMYGDIFGDTAVFKFLERVFGNIAQSFVVALLFFAVGKYLAENKEKLQKFNTAGTGLLLALSLMLMYAECFHAMDQGWNDGIQSSIFIAISAVLLVVLVLNCDIRTPVLVKCAPFLRKASVTTYYVHFIVLYILRDVLDVGWHFVIRFGVIMLICLLVSTVFFVLERRCGWKFLRYLG